MSVIAWSIADTKRYRLEKSLGWGSFGEVARGTSCESGALVAIKKLFNLYSSDLNFVRTYRELHLLGSLKHPNIVELQDIVYRVPASIYAPQLSPIPGGHIFRQSTITFSNESLVPPENFSPEIILESIKKKEGEMYLVFEYMHTDLEKLIEDDVVFSTDTVKLILYEILKGLKYIHSAAVIHRDIKPGNILLTHSQGNYIVKIADFGLARVVDSTSVCVSDPVDTQSYLKASMKKILSTVDIVTEDYRPPELMLERASYTSAVDMWSVGCILAELFGAQSLERNSRRPLFSCDYSANEGYYSDTELVNRLTFVVNRLGAPTEDDISALSEGISEDNMEIFRSTRTSDTVTNSGEFVLENLRSRYPSADLDGLDLLISLLQYNPSARPSVEIALNHPFLSSVRNTEVESIAEKQMDEERENIEESDEKIIQSMVEEIQKYATSSPVLQVPDTNL